MKLIILNIIIAFLILCTGLSIFAYMWIPDNSRNANRQIPEISLMDPGSYSCYTEKLISQSSQNEWNKLWNGDEGIFKYQIVNNDSLSKNNIKCQVFWFGTDKYGRDVLSRIFLGMRYTLLIGFSSVIISLFIGMLLGCLSGYFGGKVDQIISIFINTFWSIPTILLAFAVLLSFGRSISSVFIAIGLTMWGDTARLVRSQVLGAKQMTYVQAARALGFNNFRILFKQILPNIMGPVWISAAGNFALAVLLESGLSFLGFGLQPPVPTIGNILQEQYVYAITGKPMLALIPSIVVILLVLSFQLITNSLRDLSDVRMSVKK